MGKRLPFSVGWDEVYWLVVQNLSHRCLPSMVSELFLVVREVDEVVVDTELSHAGLSKVVGGAQVPCDLFSNPILSERPPCS